MNIQKEFKVIHRCINGAHDHGDIIIGEEEGLKEGDHRYQPAMENVMIVGKLGDGYKPTGFKILATIEPYRVPTLPMIQMPEKGDRPSYVTLQMRVVDEFTNPELFKDRVLFEDEPQHIIEVQDVEKNIITPINIR